MRAGAHNKTKSRAPLSHGKRIFDFPMSRDDFATASAAALAQGRIDCSQIAPEYLALLQQYLEAQQQHQPQVRQPQPQPQPQVSRARLSALIEHELARLAERPGPQQVPAGAVGLKHHQVSSVNR